MTAKKKTKVAVAGDLLARAVPGLLHPLDDPRPLARIAFHQDGRSGWFPGGSEGTVPLPQDRDCVRCDLSRSRKTVCMESLGEPGDPLLVLGSPTERDDAAGRALETGVTAEVLQLARPHAPGRRVRLTWAVRCAGGPEPEDAPLDACRPYLAGELDLRPPRAVVFGVSAAKALTGIAFNAHRVRRGWAVVRGVPCHFVLSPGSAQRNRFARKQLAMDVEWAMNVPVGRQPDGVVRVLLTPAEAIGWLEAAPRDPMVFDAEHWPKSPWLPIPEKEGGKFRLLALALCQDPAAPVVISEEVLLDPGVGAALKRVMEDPFFPKLNQDAKHDMGVLWRALGIDVRGIEWDTLIASRLLDSDAPNGLAKTAWKVGFGGYKELGQVEKEEDDE